MTDTWSNMPTELDLVLAKGYPVSIPVYMLGDFTADTFEAGFEEVDGTDAVEFAVETPVEVVDPPGLTAGTYTLVELGLVEADMDVNPGPLYRWIMTKNGSPMVGGQLEVREIA